MALPKYQTRDDDGAIISHDTLREAYQYAKDNENVWKISFGLGSNDDLRVRLIRGNGDRWYFEPMEDIIAEVMADAQRDLMVNDLPVS